MKGWVVKWQRTLATPLRGAAALKPSHCYWYRRHLQEKKRQKQKQCDLQTSYTHEKGNSKNTVNLP